MPDRAQARAVLVTGAYGTGKTTLIEEIADILEQRRTRYAALDLDWLSWFDPGSPDHAAATPTLLKNVDAVVGNYFETGVRIFLLAGAIGSKRSVEELRRVLAMPLATILLTAPLDQIERRLSASLTSGRQADLAMARAWLADRSRDDIGDVVVRNDRPIRLVALEALAALGW